MDTNTLDSERNPSIGEICQTVAWASMYARHPLNKSHPLWESYFTCSEWFRHHICAHLRLPPDTQWEELFRRTGRLVPEAYPTQEERAKAYRFGAQEYLSNPAAPNMFAEFERIKLQITSRV